MANKKRGVDMLKSYEVSNFKSFKNKTKFDLERTNYQMLSATNLKEIH